MNIDGNVWRVYVHNLVSDKFDPIMFQPSYDSGDWAGKRLGCKAKDFNTGESVSKNFAELGLIVKADM